MRSSVSPVPCSMESIPAAISPGSASSPKTWAATRAPSSWARAMPAASASSGNVGARSPTSRSIQSAAILTQPSPGARPAARPRRPGRRARPRRRARGCSASVRAMCRPARISRGRSSRSLHAAVVDRRAGVAQQQRAGVAVEQRLLGLRLGVRDVALRRQPDVAVGVDEAGRDPAAGGDRLGVARRAG